MGTSKLKLLGSPLFWAAICLLCPNAFATSVSTQEQDYCAVYNPQIPTNTELSAAALVRPEDVTQACTEIQLRSINSLPIRNLLRPLREEAAFLEMVRRRAREMAELSEQEANYIEYCFASRPNPQNHIFAWAQQDATIGDSIRRFCEQLRPKIQEQASQLPEYRRHLSLMLPPLVNAGVHSNALRLDSKINPNIAPYYYDFSLRRLVQATLPPLIPSEQTLAGADYDAAFLGIRAEVRQAQQERNPPLPPGDAPESNRRQIEERMNAWRSEQGRLARNMLAQNPLLGHFRSVTVTNDSIAAAAASVRERARDTIRRLDAMEREIPRRDHGAYDLLLIEGAVSDVLSENPSFCQAANLARSHYQSVTAIKEAQLFAGAFVLGTVCFLAIRNPGPCMMTTFTGAATYNYGWEVLPRHSFRLAAFESALSQDRSIVRLLNELDDSERQTFIAIILIVVPWEAGAALPYHLAYHRSLRFRAIVDRISSTVQLPANVVIERIMGMIRNARGAPPSVPPTP